MPQYQTQEGRNADFKWVVRYSWSSRVSIFIIFDLQSFSELWPDTAASDWTTIRWSFLVDTLTEHTKPASGKSRTTPGPKSESSLRLNTVLDHIMNNFYNFRVPLGVQHCTLAAQFIIFPDIQVRIRITESIWRRMKKSKKSSEFRITQASTTILFFFLPLLTIAFKIC